MKTPYIEVPFTLLDYGVLLCYIIHAQWNLIRKLAKTCAHARMCWQLSLDPLSRALRDRRDEPEPDYISKADPLFTIPIVQPALKTATCKMAGAD